MIHIFILIGVLIVGLYLIFKKNLEELVLWLIIGMGIACWVPFAIDNFFINNIRVKKEIVEFWSNYLGNILGALIGLFGIYWENTRKENKKANKDRENLLIALNYDLEINLKDENFEKKKYNLLSVLNFTEISFLYKDDIEAIHSFKNVDLKKNLLEILNLEYGKEIIEIQSKINIFNNEWLFLIKNSKERKNILEKMKKSNNEELKNIIEIIEILSDMIFCYSSYNFTSWHIERLNFLKKLLYMDRKHLIKEKDLFDLLEEINNYNFSTQSEEEMNYLLKLIKESIKILQYFPYVEEIISFEEESELSKHCNSASIIASINIFDLFEEMKKVNKLISEEK